jgi:two-component system chemotaxis response regulator CheY
MALRILVVDDEEDVELLFRQRFRKEANEGKVNLHFANSGAKALLELQDVSNQDIIIILSDINMPGMTGLELLEKIKQKYPNKKVMMISAYGNEQYMNEAQQKGADDFFTKPVDFKLLKEKILSGNI